MTEREQKDLYFFFGQNVAIKNGLEFTKVTWSDFRVLSSSS